jgi:hypothetical protein
MTDNKTRPTDVSVASFVEALTDETRRADAQALIALMQEATGERATMWGPSIIGFGSYRYKYESGREGDAPLVGFSPRKAATVIYGLNLAHSEDLLTGLGKHTTGKGCLYINKLADVNRSVLEELLLKAVAGRRSRLVGK